MPELRKSNGTGQLNGSTGAGTTAPRPAPVAPTPAAASSTTTRRPTMHPSSIQCFTCGVEYHSNEWDGELRKTEFGDMQSMCSQCLFDETPPTPKPPKLTPEQYAQMKRVLYPTKHQMASIAGDMEAEGAHTQAKMYWRRVMAGEINPNQVDDPWA